MDGWIMDRWMDGRINGRKDGQVNWWIDVCRDEWTLCMYRWMDTYGYRWMDVSYRQISDWMSNHLGCMEVGWPLVYHPQPAQRTTHRPVAAPHSHLSVTPGYIPAGTVYNRPYLKSVCEPCIHMTGWGWWWAWRSSPWKLIINHGQTRTKIDTNSNWASTANRRAFEQKG
jgi:hypothetical protein